MSNPAALTFAILTGDVESYGISGGGNRDISNRTTECQYSIGNCCDRIFPVAHDGWSHLYQCQGLWWLLLHHQLPEPYRQRQVFRSAPSYQRGCSRIAVDDDIHKWHTRLKPPLRYCSEFQWQLFAQGQVFRDNAWCFVWCKGTFGPVCRCGDQSILFDTVSVCVM